MNTHRAVYALTLALSVVFYILYSYWFSWYLLVLILLLIPFDLIVSLPGMLTRRIMLTAPKVLIQGTEAYMSAIMIQSGPYPIRCIKTRLRVKCEDFNKRRRIICGAERGAMCKVGIDTTRSGVMSFEIKRCWIVSLLCLFSIPATVENRVSSLILPAPVKPANILSLPRGDTLRPKPGGGFSEDHDLRGYRQGDPLRSIHWKVSAKHDALIVREPLAPSLHSRLVRVMEWNDPQERDLILGRLLWVSDYLNKIDLQFFIKLGESGPTAEISGRNDLENYLYYVLSGEAHALKTPVSLPARFTWEFRVDASEGAGQLSAES